MALDERRIAAEDSREYCGALAAWAVFNTNRKKGAGMMPVTDFMLRLKSRGKAAPGDAGGGEGMRYALPGERPPSRYAPGTKDNVIERFDAYMQSVQGTEVPPWARPQGL